MTERLLGDDAPDVEPAPPPSDAELTRVRDLARKQYGLQLEIEKLEATLKSKQAELRQVAEVELPEALSRIGCERFDLVGGYRVETGTEYHASIPKDRFDEAEKWLERRGHGGIVKHEIKLLFPRDETKWALKFLRDLGRRKRPIPYKRRDFVEPATLGAFVREQVAAGTLTFDDYPLFGVYARRFAKIVAPKPPPGAEKSPGSTSEGEVA